MSVPLPPRRRGRSGLHRAAHLRNPPDPASANDSAPRECRVVCGSLA